MTLKQRKQKRARVRTVLHSTPLDYTEEDRAAYYECMAAQSTVNRLK